MMFIKKEDTELNSRLFVERMRGKPVDVIVSKSVRGFSTELALRSFTSFITSVSHRMIQKRSKQK